LLRQAHVEGLINCRDAELLDPKWWLKLHWTLDWLEQKNHVEVIKLQHSMHCSLLDYFTGDEAVNLHWDQAISLQHRVSMLLLPWIKYSGGKLKRREFKKLVDLWCSVFGDYRDPQVQERIDRTVKSLYAAAQDAVARGGRYGN
jgi:hypothetical protein